MSHTPQVVLVGPTHPYTGGIAQHTTRLALELQEAGVAVEVESWKAQYPRFLYPGTPTVPRDEPEIGVAHHVTERLTWYSPFSWWAAGRRARGATLAIVSVPTAFHALPYTVFRLARGPSRPVWAIVHNVTPHDSGRLSRAIMGSFLRRLDRIIVHGPEAVSQAVALGCRPERMSERALPSPWPEGDLLPAGKEGTDSAITALFFGTIRAYKGLDVLLEAIGQVPNLKLLVAGEFWEDRARYDEIISRLRIGDRVAFRPGYLPSSQFAEVFSTADILVLPYRSGSGSIVREVGYRFGLPVIATSTGAIADGVEEEGTGMVVEPGNAEALAQALRLATDSTTRATWREAVARRTAKNRAKWDDYVRAISDGLTPSL